MRVWYNVYYSCLPSRRRGLDSRHPHHNNYYRHALVARDGLEQRASIPRAGVRYACGISQGSPLLQTDFAKMWRRARVKRESSQRLEHPVLC